MGVANSQALALADITEASSNPENGKNGRLPDSKEPNGYLEEDAADLVLMPLLADSSIELADLIEAAQYVYLSHGITTVQEGAATQAGMEELIALTQSDQFKVDVVAYTDGAVQEYITMALKEGQQLLAHANDDAASKQLLYLIRTHFRS